MLQKRQLLRRLLLQKKCLKIGMNNVKKRQNSVKLITGKKIHALLMQQIKHQMHQKNKALLLAETFLTLPQLQMLILLKIQLLLWSHKKLLHLGRNWLRQKHVIVRLSNWLIFLKHLVMLSLMKLMTLNNSLIHIELRVMIMYMFPMRTMHIHQMKNIRMSLELQQTLMMKNQNSLIKIQQQAHQKRITVLLPPLCQERVQLQAL